MEGSSKIKFNFLLGDLRKSQLSVLRKIGTLHELDCLGVSHQSKQLLSIAMRR